MADKKMSPPAGNRRASTNTGQAVDPDSHTSPKQGRSELREYLDHVLGDTPGVLHTAVGSDPYLTEAGKYKHKKWEQFTYDWPAEADRAERELLQSATHSDAYACPYVSTRPDKRAKGAAAAHTIAHADVDRVVDTGKVREAGGCAVASGTPGHAHVYVGLTRPVPAHQHRALCIGLGNYLGGADSKIADNDVLRPPGTLNLKPTTVGGDPTPVQWLVPPPPLRVDPADLADTLGVTLCDTTDLGASRTATTGPPATPVSTAGMIVEAVDPAKYPQVRDALTNDTGDRSADTMRVVGACRDAGLTLAQTRNVVDTRPDLAARLAERDDDDVLTCWLKAVDSRQQPRTNTQQQVVETRPGTGSARDVNPVTLVTLDEAHQVFKGWLGDDYDTDALNAVLAAAAVESLDGDPLWLLLISGSGNAKTETVQALDGINAVITSTISSCGALLSATAKKERAKEATGGLLRKLEPRGVLVIKDVTSILSMSGDARAEVLGALREVYDGRWSRNVGTDGGLTLEWAGRIAVIGAVTTAWDKAHAAIASMGDRFVLIRMDSTTARQAAGRKAIGNTGDETVMRRELAEAVAGVLAGIGRDPIKVTNDETDVLLAAADLVTLSRTGVEYDYRGDVIDAHAPEMPTRFAKQLAQVVRGGVAVGMDRASALRLAIRCARDSMPPLRLAIVDDVAANPDSSTADIRKRLGKPRATVDRQLQALHMLGVLECDEQEVTWSGREATRWYYRLAEGIEPTALDPKSVPDLAVPTPIPQRRGVGEQTSEQTSLHTPPAKSGTDFATRRGPIATGPGRCDECGWHIETQGHDDVCEAAS